MLSDEEKKAIERINNSYDYNTGWVEADASDWRVVTDLIEKQSKEIEELKETLKCTQNSWYEDAKIVDKIKAKIEEAKKSYNDLHTKHLRDCGIAEQRELAKIQVLQSLLEKE